MSWRGVSIAAVSMSYQTLHCPTVLCVSVKDLTTAGFAPEAKGKGNKSRLVSHGMDTSAVLLNASLPSKGTKPECTYPFLLFLWGSICTQASYFLKEDLGMYGQGQTDLVVCLQLDEPLPQGSTADVPWHSTTWKSYDLLDLRVSCCQGRGVLQKRL